MSCNVASNLAKVEVIRNARMNELLWILSFFRVVVHSFGLGLEDCQDKLKANDDQLLLVGNSQVTKADVILTRGARHKLNNPLPNAPFLL